LFALFFFKSEKVFCYISIVEESGSLKLASNEEMIVRIIDNSGRRINEFNNREVTISGENLPSGIYFLDINNEKHLKFVVIDNFLFGVMGIDKVLIGQPETVPFYPDRVSIDEPQNFPNIETIINDPIPDISIYGLYAWYTYFSDYAHWQNEVGEVGWGSIRAGAHLTEFNDNAMRALNSIDIEIMLTVSGGRTKVRSYYGLDWDDETQDQAFIDEYISYMDTILSRYGPGGSFFDDYPGEPYKPIKYVEIWNEPNLHYLYGAYLDNPPSLSQKARLYAKLLVASYNHIKEKWGDSIKVVGLSACGGSADDIYWGPEPLNPDSGFIGLVHKYVEDIGGDPSNFYDILSDHPYTHNCPPDAEDYPVGRDSYHYSVANSHNKYRQIMADYGNEDKPVWFTEVGYNRLNGVFEQDEGLTERFQAAYVVRLYLTALRLGVETVHVMFMVDADGTNTGFFIYDTREWYESAYAVQNMIRIIPKPKLIGAISDGIAGYYAYRFNPNAESSNYDPVIVAWNVSGSTTVTIPAESGIYEIIDMLGNSITLEAENNQLEVKIGPYPVYILPL
jgi:hypothetical protein